MTKIWAALAAGIIPALLFMFRWFLLKTDVLIGYNWSWKGSDFYPNFDIRNRSGSKTFVLANIRYTKNEGTDVIAIDNASIWGREIKPGTITHLEGAVVPKVTSFQDCLEVEVAVRLQNGREFKGHGPGQHFTGFRKLGYTLRQWIEKESLPLAN